MAKLTLDKFLLQLAEKANIPATDPKLADLLANTELQRIQISDDVVNDLESKLISVEEAKANHPAIKTHYFAEIMSNVDRVLDGIYTDHEFTDAEKAELQKERSSTKRIALVAKALKDKAEAAATAAAGKNKGNESEKITTLTQQVNDLNNQLAAAKQETATLKTTHAGEIADVKKENILNGKLSGLKTIYDTLPGDVKAMTVRNLLTKELQDNGIKLVLNETGGLVLQKEDGTNYFDEQNRQVSVDDFIQKSLAKHKVLPQNNPPAPKAGEPGADPIITGKPKTEGGYSLKGMIDEATESLNNQNPAVITTP